MKEMGSKLQYSHQQMLSALEAVANGTSIAAASKLHGVPRSTLADKHRGKVPIERKMGPDTLLSSAEEYQLVQWMFDVAAVGFPVTQEQLLDSVKLLLCDLNKSSLFKSGRPGRTWYESFLKRHPDISKRVPQNLTKSRGGITEEQLRGWFNEVSNYFVSNNLLSILNDPRRSFNCDETAFFLCPKGNHVLVRKGEKAVYNFINCNERECLTTLVTGNAAGELAPPMIIFSYKRIPSEIAESIPKKWGLGVSDNGWMTSETFYQYTSNIFHPWLLSKKIPLPVVLYLDGHTSHLTMSVSNFCRENQIILVALYPNATHILQPMDVAVFSPLKKEWKKTVHNWRMKNGGERLTRKNFAPLLELTIKNCNLQQSLQNGFRSCGLHPFSPDSIDYTKLLQPRKSADVPMLDKEDIKYHLQFIENNLTARKVNSFYSSGSSWSGNIEDKSLFDFWLSLKIKIGEIEVNRVDNHLNEEQVEEISTVEDVDPNVIEEIEDNRVDNHLNEEQVEEILTVEDVDPKAVEDIPLANFKMVVVDATDEELIIMSDILRSEPLDAIQNIIPLNEQLVESDKAEIIDVPPAIIIDTHIPSTSATVTIDSIILNQDVERNLQDSQYSEKEPQEDIENNLNTLNNREVPSPFKRALPWPSLEMQSRKKKSKMSKGGKEKIPTVITGEEWVKYQKKKEEEKNLLKLQAAEKKKERMRKAEEKKLVLEAKREERKKKREENAEIKRKLLMIKKEHKEVNKKAKSKRENCRKSRKISCEE